MNKQTFVKFLREVVIPSIERAEYVSLSDHLKDIEKTIRNVNSSGIKSGDEMIVDLALKCEGVLIYELCKAQDLYKTVIGTDNFKAFEEWGQ